MAGRIGNIFLKGAIAAYSLRRLTPQYKGPAVRIRRDSDNAETDIGFTSNGELDTAAISSFVASNSAFVTMWYDQTGFGVHQSRTIANQQPQIVSSGTLITDNSKPAIYFNGTTSLTSVIPTNQLTSPVGEWSSFGVVRVTNYTAGRVLLSSDSRPLYPSRIGQFLRAAAIPGRWGTVAFRNDGSFVEETGVLLSPNQVILNTIRTVNSVEIFANGASNGPTSITGNAAAGLTNFLDVGYRGGIDNSPGFQPFGNIQELIHYNVDVSSYYRYVLNNLNSYYRVY